MKSASPRFILLKKIISYFLFSNFIGFLIRKIYKNNIPLYDSYISTSNHLFKNSIIAKIFFRSYEGAELRFIKEYISDKFDIIELGSSLGIVSSVLATKLSQSNKKLICIEANSHLIPALIKNIYTNRKNGPSFIENVVINYNHEDGGNVNFYLDDNHLVSNKYKLNKNDLSKVSEKVKSSDLKTILFKYEIEEYILICDIEGSEIEIFENEKLCLSNCVMLIIELHDTFYKGKYYTVNELVSILLNKYHFEIIDSYDCVYVFKNPKI
jgi:FkbM family methyltransferase